MKRILIVIILLALTKSLAFSADKLVVVYYQGWEYTGNQKPWQLQYQYMTHIVHIFGGPTDANTGTAPYWNLLRAADSTTFFWSAGKNMVDSLVNRAHANNVKVLVCLGSGGTMNSVMNDSAKTWKLSCAVVDFAKRHNYDGVDVDWEAGDRTDAGMARLFRMLRRRMTTTWTGYRTRGLLCASPSSGEFLTVHPDSMDWVQPQMYDLNRTWNDPDGGTGYTEYGGGSERFGFNAPLRTPSSASQGMNQYRWQTNWEGIYPGYGDTTTIRFGPRYYLAHGWDTSKVLVGFSPTGYGTDLVPDPRYGGQTWWGNSWNGRGGIVSTAWWKAALAAGATRNFEPRSCTAWLGGMTRVAVNAVLYNGFSVAAGRTFCAVGEDSETVKLKAQWIRSNHLGGIMYYDITGGYDPSYIAGKDQPLLYLLYRELRGTPGPPPTLPVPYDHITFSSVFDIREANRDTLVPVMVRVQKPAPLLPLGAYDPVTILGQTINFRRGNVDTTVKVNVRIQK